MPLLDEMLMIDPPPARFIDGDDRLHAEHGAGEVHVDDLAELVDVLLLDRREVEDAGVVHQDAHRTEARLAVLDGRHPLLLGR